MALKYGEYLFTFLDYPDLPPDNSFGERQIQPALQAPALVAFSIAKALKTYLTTGQLPLLPEQTIADR